MSDPAESGINLSQSCHDRAHTDGVPQVQKKNAKLKYFSTEVNIIVRSQLKTTRRRRTASPPLLPEDRNQGERASQQKKRRRVRLALRTEEVGGRPPGLGKSRARTSLFPHLHSSSLTRVPSP